MAITGASFAPDVPAWVETFASLTESAQLCFTGAVSGAAFAKHGTSFETRISVFDKCCGGEAGGITADLTRPMGPDVFADHSPCTIAPDAGNASIARVNSSFPLSEKFCSCHANRQWQVSRYVRNGHQKHLNTDRC